MPGCLGASTLSSFLALCAKSKRRNKSWCYFWEEVCSIGRSELFPFMHTTYVKEQPRGICLQTTPEAVQGSLPWKAEGSCWLWRSGELSACHGQGGDFLCTASSPLVCSSLPDDKCAFYYSNWFNSNFRNFIAYWDFTQWVKWKKCVPEPGLNPPSWIPWAKSSSHATPSSCSGRQKESVGVAPSGLNSALTMGNCHGLEPWAWQIYSWCYFAISVLC